VTLVTVRGPEWAFEGQGDYLFGAALRGATGGATRPPLPVHGIHVTESSPGRERAPTILVAEDDDVLRGIVTRVFWDQGFRTLEARHGGEALHLAELAAPYLDLVVTDVIMPEVDGLELGRRLAQRWASIPVLYISAYPPNDIFSRGGPAQPSPFLQKPFTPEVLLARVRELLDAPRPGA
jgi:two-component system, cell cycle sensor histidine kinase and response regulator CckA